MGSFWLNLRCKKTGLDKRIEFLYSNNDSSHLPSKGVLLEYKDTGEPQFNGTYKVKNIIGNTEVNSTKSGRIEYTLELKKIK